jgi:hypothetical protein
MKSGDSMENLIFTCLFDSIQVDNNFVFVLEKQKTNAGRGTGEQEDGLENQNMKM